jgi:hypothetical protein
MGIHKFKSKQQNTIIKKNIIQIRFRNKIYSMENINRININIQQKPKRHK